MAEVTIACPICFRSVALSGENGLVVHILAAHPDSAVGQRIVETLRELEPLPTE